EGDGRHGEHARGGGGAAVVVGDGEGHGVAAARRRREAEACARAGGHHHVALQHPPAGRLRVGRAGVGEVAGEGHLLAADGAGRAAEVVDGGGHIEDVDRGGRRALAAVLVGHGQRHGVAAVVVRGEGERRVRPRPVGYAVL